MKAKILPGYVYKVVAGVTDRRPYDPFPKLETVGAVITKVHK